MKRKLTLNVLMIVAVLVATSAFVFRHIQTMRTHEHAMSYSLHNLEHFSRLYYLSTLVQQHQSEIRYGITRETQPLTENFQEIQSLVGEIRNELIDPDVEASCMTCHAKLTTDGWRQLRPRMETLTQLLATYRDHVEDTVMSDDPRTRERNDAMGLYLSRNIVLQTHEMEAGFDKMTGHLVQQYHVWAARTGRNTALVIVTGLLLMIFFVTRMLRQFMSPILELNRAAMAVSAGRYPEKLEIKTRDELETLAETFNTMVENLRRVTDEREELLNQTQNFNTVLEQRIREVREELEAARETLVRSETLSAIGTLASGVAHEINNPIHVIMGIADLAQRDLPPDSPLAGDIKMIETEAARCQRIVAQLLDYGRRSEPDFALGQVNDVVHDTVELVGPQIRKQRVELVVEPEPSLPPIYMDRNRIKQVLVNLIINAKQAVKEGGRVVVRTRQDAGANFAVIEVEDNGSGIPPEILSKIFDPFFTTKKGTEGTGLGLSITHRIVAEHDGTIAVKSRVGEGTNFTIKLPLGARATAAVDSARYKRAAGGEHG